jgi:alpha-galactosidase
MLCNINTKICLLIACAALATCLDNGAAPKPPMGWSTWNTFECDITEQLVKQSADIMAASALKVAGYEYILIDDCWSLCLNKSKTGDCSVPAPRDSDGRIVPDPNKFPSGMKSLADYVHSKGLKIGIYTASSARTCAGYEGSLGHEHTDALAFGEWGFDFVKMDTCGTDCSIHNGCLRNSLNAMRDGLNATGKTIVFYVDDGNDSSGPRIYNPFLHHINVDDMVKIAYAADELVWNWGPSTANMWKSWLDIHDSWYSTIDNIHMQIGLAMYQKCGAFNTPDMLTVGQGGQTLNQYRAQMFMWAVLGAPLILGCDIRKMDNDTLALVTAPEVLAINQDKECVQASLASSFSGGEVWVKPLSDGSFGVVLLNTLSKPQTIQLQLNDKWADNFGSFYPAKVNEASIRDAWQRKDLGDYKGVFEGEVQGHDAMILRVFPKAGH